MVKEPERTQSVGLGAIVAIGAGTDADGVGSISRPGGDGLLFSEPMECIEILGRSMLERTIERFIRTDVKAITVLMGRGCSLPESVTESDKVSVLVAADVNSAMAETLNEYSQTGIDHSFVTSASLYTETDLLDLFYFHREARQAATWCLDREGPLDLMVVDCAKAQEVEFERLLSRPREISGSYFIRDYVSRLTHPRDLRRLVCDTLYGRCAMRPTGTEVKPGIWVEEGAEIHRRARIVAPAFIGAGSRVEEDTVITRCSNVENRCYVDCGTVVEDSSILANTHVGIWLDVCHAVASGNKLLSLTHEVMVEISDASILRSNRAAQPEAQPGSNHQVQSAEQQIVAAIQSQPPTPETCGLEPILSRGD